MATWQGRKVWASGAKLNAVDLNSLVDQSVMVFASATARDTAITSPTEGMVVYQTDTDQVYVYSGTAWVSAFDITAWTTYTPTITATTTNPSFTYTTQAGSYVQVGKLVAFRMAFVINAATAVGTGSYRFDLPVTPAATTTHQMFFGRYVDASTNNTYRVMGVGATGGGLGTGMIQSVTYSDGVGTNILGNALPVAPQASDAYYFQGIYEAA